MKKNKGFTLLELLVVIAIIGILSTIVMVSLQGARQRAQDAAIQSYINQIRAQVLIEHPDGNYENFDETGTEVANLIANIEATGSTVTPLGDNNTYCVSAESIATDNHFCVDSTGNITDGTETCSDAGAEGYKCN